MTALETIRVDAPDPRATVVLVHGAWHGGWERISDELADWVLQNTATVRRLATRLAC